tara:strand:- start:232 stop:390 length:159 start_codon:yes stop_codon:yes gene_type:complete
MDEEIKTVLVEILDLMHQMHSNTGVRHLGIQHEQTMDVYDKIKKLKASVSER